MSKCVLSDKQQRLLKQLSDGQFHSGSVLAQSLGVSRVAVAKHIKQLAETLSLDVTAITGKGYCLAQPLELLNSAFILEQLNTDAKAVLTGLDIHTQIDSTNRYLMDVLRQQSQSGLVCFAEQQTQGKGRRGRHWVSPFGHNIYLSIAWQFATGAATLSGLSLAVGVAVIRALNQVGVNEVGLKWPNDIYAQGKKLGGVLIEVSGETDGTCNAVIGLGLNVFLSKAQGATINQAWTDLHTLLGERPLLRNRLAVALLNELLPLIAHFTELGITPYLDEWRQYDCLKQQAATLFIGQHTITGIVLGIDDTGLLLLEHSGKVQAFASGEVSFSAGIN